jgi:hypothetical protein
MTTPTPGPFITSQDQYDAKSEHPFDIGQMKLANLNFNMNMTDAELRALAEQAIVLRDRYKAWEEFYTDFTFRKARLFGFDAVMSNLDVVQVAAELGTTVAKLAASMGGRASAERARIAVLQQYWDTGQLPVGDVLTETVIPSAGFTMQPNATFAPAYVIFTNKSTNGSSQFLWDFGDGQTSTEANPIHTYNDNGTYTITLKARNTAGWSSVVSKVLTLAPLVVPPDSPPIMA